MAQTIGQWLLCLKHYLLMCVFLSSPERLPYNPLCTLISLFAYILIGLLLVDEQRGMASVSAQIFLEVIMLALIAYAGLYWKKSLLRFQQTISALIGINMVISAVTIPVYHLVSSSGESAGNGGSLLVFAPLVPPLPPERLRSLAIRPPLLQ